MRRAVTTLLVLVGIAGLLYALVPEDWPEHVDSAGGFAIRFPDPPHDDPPPARPDCVAQGGATWTDRSTRTVLTVIWGESKTRFPLPPAEMVRALERAAARAVDGGRVVSESETQVDGRAVADATVETPRTRFRIRMALEGHRVIQASAVYDSDRPGAEADAERFIGSLRFLAPATATAR